MGIELTGSGRIGSAHAQVLPGIEAVDEFPSTGPATGCATTVAAARSDRADTVQTVPNFYEKTLTPGLADSLAHAGEIERAWTPVRLMEIAA